MSDDGYAFYRHEGPRLYTLLGDGGKTIVQINLDTGAVQITGDIDDAAKLFWATVENTCPTAERDALRKEIAAVTVQRDKAIQNRLLCERAMDCERLREQMRGLTLEIRDAVVLLATANPGEDLPNQEAADLWCDACAAYLLKHENLVGLDAAALASKGDGKGDATP